MITRTPKEEWGKKCCSKCNKARIKNYDEFNYHCLLVCPHFNGVRIIEYLDKHYCDDFEEVEE